MTPETTPPAGGAGRETYDVHTVKELGGYGTLGAYVLGHHDPAAVLAYCLDEGYADAGEVEIHDVRQTYYRKTPTGDAGWYMLNECGPGRGAFAVTLVDTEGARIARAMARRISAAQAAAPPEGE